MKIIAECGINWQGDIHVAAEMIRQAKINGADAVKFQLYSSQALWGDDSRKHLELSLDDWYFLVGYAERQKIDIFPSVFDEERLEWCKVMGITKYKIPWRVLRDDPDLVDKVHEAAIDMLVVSCLLDEKYKLPPYDGDYLQLTEGYPCYWPEPYSCEFEGISDHTLGISYALNSIAQGATIIEKHFSLQKQFAGKTGRGNDHVCSMTPHDLYLLSTLGREMESTRGGE